jgi:hypothetical protein
MRSSNRGAGDELLTLHIAVVGDWTKGLLQLVRDGQDEAGRATGPRFPWWSRRSHKFKFAEHSTTALADIENGSKDKAAANGKAAAAAVGAEGDDGLAALRADMPTIYLQGPFGAPAMAFKRYQVLVLASTGVG